MIIETSWTKEIAATNAAVGLLSQLKRLLALSLIAIIAGSDLARAEYRAHRLKIENTLTGQSREVVSTLDHLQYRGYYPLSLGERVLLAGSWHCRGRTSRRPICRDPGVLKSAQPSSQSPQSTPPPDITPQG